MAMSDKKEPPIYPPRPARRAGARPVRRVGIATLISTLAAVAFAAAAAAYAADDYAIRRS
jgi:hypothetical protein